MILRSITLDDFGLYAGSNKIDLVPRRRKGFESPIILIGGKNGAGKTTLLDAIRLSLYGRRALGTRVGQAEYEHYLRGAVHRVGDIHTAAVGIEFDYAEGGVVHRYHVRREWTVRDKGVTETLHVDKDGAAVSSVPREEWHQFLQELIPPGVSQLFFFDGEKIREIAEEQDNEHLAEAVRGLLGIELVSRLRTDLGLYIARHQSDDRPADAEQLERVLRDMGELQRQVTDVAEKAAELTSLRESQARAAEQIRRRFVSEGGDAAAQRTRIEGQRDELKRKIAHCQHGLHDLAQGLLPFTLAPRLLKKFQDALQQSGQLQDQKDTAKKLERAFTSWRKDTSAARNARWNEKHWADLTRFMKTWVQAAKSERALPPALKEVGDGAAALARLSEVNATVRPKAIALAGELEAATSRLAKVEAALLRADTAAAGVLLDELRLADQTLGATEATLHTRQEELKLLKGQLVTLDRDRRRLLENQSSELLASGRLVLAGRVTGALAAYEARLLDHKLNQLRTEFIRRFNLLARKAEFITDASIDRDTFATILVDRSGREVPKSSLSAGEKQIYAIAMLWALARTSQRPLPMIIDTPLARLDSEHRQNLIERYFPTASHQVVLLSTDTEVDVALQQRLGASVSHTYRLDYDPQSGRTVPSQGYFGDEHQREQSRALQ
ncbi:MAG: DNA sulfur modification protein DndD [Alphaproteobacteria bacterium]